MYYLITEHIANTTHKEIDIKAATFHFKVCEKGRIWLMFISSINTSSAKMLKQITKNSMLDVKFNLNVEANFNKQRHEVLLTSFCYNCYDSYSRHL